MKKVGKSLLFAVMLMALVLCGALLASCSGNGCGTGGSKSCAHKEATFAVVKEATCTDAGTTHYDCPKCGKSWDETVKALGHDMNETVEEPDCLTAGYKISNCLRCGTMEKETLDPLGHDWEKDGETVKVSCDKAGTTVRKCLHTGCEATKVDVTPASGHTFKEKSSKDANCLTAGSTTYACQNCDVEYTVTTAALGHTYTREADCTQAASACRTCGKPGTPALGHDFQVEHFDVTCEEDGVDVYRCQRENCTEYGEVITEHATGHNEAGVRDWQVLRHDAEGDVCVEVQEGTCPDCHDPITRTVEKDHVYTSRIDRAATCTDEGQKTLTCKNCHEYHTEAIMPNENAHLWMLAPDQESDNMVTYVCDHDANHTKTSVSYVGQTTANISADVLDKAHDIEVSDVTIALDAGAKGVLQNATDVEISANVVDNDVLGDQIEGLQDAKVYNFTMSADNAPVTNFDGTVTVRIPYNLAEGEDPDEIVILYFDENANQLTEQIATYCEINGQGYAVLETNHFSYYTVTRMTNEDRCVKFGHAEKAISRNATCTTNGYDITLCTRCGVTLSRTEKPAVGHDWEDTVVSVASCTTAGHTEHRCKNCNAGYDVNVPVLGHDWDIVLQPGNCTESGKATYTCNRCDEEHEEDLPAPGHDYVMTVVAATCQASGYKQYVCSICDDEYKDSYTATTEHNWNAEVATCAAGKYCLDCGSEAESKLPHSYNDQHVCAVCGSGCEHKFADKQKIAATCTAGGYTIKICGFCDFETRGDATAALGHNYNNSGVCTVCGAKRPANESFYLNVLESLLSEKMTVTVENLSFDMTDVTYDFKGNVTNTSVTKVTQLDVMQLTYILSDDGSLYGAGSGKIRMKQTNSRYDEDDTIIADAQMIMKDGYLYAVLTGSNNDESQEMYVRMPLDFMMESLSAMNEETSGYEMFREVYEWLKGDVADILGKLIDKNGTDLNAALDKFLGNLLPYSVSGSDYTLKINYNFIVQVFDDVMSLTLDEFADKYVSDGLIESLPEKAEELLGKTVSNILTDLGDAGLDIDSVYAAIDKLMFTVTGEKFDSKAMLEQLAFIEGKTIYQTKVSEIVFFAIAQKSGDETMDVTDAEQVKAFAESLVQQVEAFAEQAKELTVMEFMSHMGGSSEVRPPEEDNRPGNTIQGKVEYADYDEPNNPSAPGSGDVISVPVKDFREIFNKAIEELKKVCNVAIRTDKDGHIKDIVATIENFTYTDKWEDSWDGSYSESKVMYSGKVTYTPAGTQASFEKSVIDAVEKALPKFTQDLVLNIPDGAQYSLTVDKNGNLVSATAEVSSTREYPRGNSQAPSGENCVIYEVNETTESIRYDFIGGGLIALQKNYCGDWDEYNVEGKYTQQRSYVYYTEYRSVTTGKVVYKTDEQRNEGYAARGTRELTLYYNTKTKEFSAINPHNYVLDEEKSTAPKDCEDVGHRYHTCENCGNEIIETWTKGHNSQVKKIELLKAGTSCENGILITMACTVCGKETGQRKEYSHNTYAVETIDLSKYGAKCGTTVKVYGCACGKREQSIEVSRECEFSRVYDHWRTDANGIQHDVSIYTCAVSNCGFTYVRDSYSTADNKTCAETRHTDYYFGVTFPGDGNPVDLFMAKEFGSKLTKKLAYLTGGYMHAYKGTDREIPATRKNTATGYEITSGYRSSNTCMVCGATYSHENRVTQVYNNSNVLTNRIETEININEDRTKSVYIRTYDASGNRTQYRQESYNAKGVLTSAETTTYRKMNGYYVRSAEVREQLIDDVLVEYSRVVYNYPVDCCHYTATYTYYYGDTRTETGTSHVDWRHHYGDTCTQGSYEECVACGEKNFRAGDYAEGHYWQHYGDHYICGRCGLESEVGASGWLVLEDLTKNEAYGEKGFYTVGFGVQHNSAGLGVSDDGVITLYAPFGEFGIELSFVVDGAELAPLDPYMVNELIDLEKTIAANDRGARLIVINADAVEQFAQELDGDDVMLRVTFVPNFGMGDWVRSDYSITLDRYTEA